MVKKNNKPSRKAGKKNKMGGNTQRRTNTVVRTVGRGLDAAAIKWARLLSDPCGAPITQGCYPTGGTGMLVRVNAFAQLLTGTNNNFQFSFMPGTNTYTLGQTIDGATGTIGANTKAFALLDSYDSFRCVAACARILYTATEGARSGTVGTATTAGPLLNAGSTGVGSTPLLAIMQRVHRTGEVVHETKWIPSLCDQDFLASGDVENFSKHATVTFIGQGFQLASALVEMTAVYEVIPTFGNGLTASTAPPPSGNTAGEVLRALGDASKWAFSNVVAPVIKASAGMAMQTVTNTPQLLAGASRVAMLM